MTNSHVIHQPVAMKFSWPSVAVFIGFYALLNAPYWGLSQVFFMNRPLFNLELVLPLLLLPFSLQLARLLLLLLWLADLVVGMSATFYFNSPAEFLRAAQFLPTLSLNKYLTAEALCIALVFGAIVYALRWCRTTITASWLAAVCCVALLFTGDVLNGSSMFSKRAERLVDVNVAGSATAMLVLRSVIQRDDRKLAPLLTGNTASVLADPVQWAHSHPDGSVLLVLVESFGTHNHSEVLDWLKARLQKGGVDKRFEFREGRIRFNGSTTDGEMRELCKLAGSYRSMTTDVATQCLPRQLAKLGWDTTAMHGFSGAMFRRESWWPDIGFKEQLFAPTFLASGAHRCGGAFAGVCDADILNAAAQRARKPRQFVYALTLNSHLPLGNVDVPDDLGALCHRLDLGSADCRLTAALAHVMDALNGSLATGPGPLPLVLIVGDHAPPFGELSQRRAYSQTVVPGFALVPHEGAGPQ